MSEKQKRKDVELPTSLKNLRFVQDVIDGEFDKKPEASKEKSTFTEDINKKEWSMQQMIDNLVQKQQKSSNQQNKNPLIISSKTSQNKILFGNNNQEKNEDFSRYIPPSDKK
ncbi:hypothetical protein ABPG74_005880 [Tetrahymena malaccensis]